MNIGMLWFDNDSKATVSARIRRASDYYQRKYGQKPDLCYIHPSMMGSDDMRAAGVEVRSTKSVLPDHFWIGIKSDSPAATA